MLTTITSEAARTWIAEHLAWRYRLDLHTDRDRSILSDGQRTIDLTAEVAIVDGMAAVALEPPHSIPNPHRPFEQTPLDDMEASLLRRHGIDAQPRGWSNQLRVWLTHDVDQLRMSYQLWTRLARSVRTGRVADAARLFSDWAGARARGTDIWDNIGEIAELERNGNAPATFFILEQPRLGRQPGLPFAPFNLGLYSLSDPRIRQSLADVVALGGELALHGALHPELPGTFLDAERSKLESVAGVPIRAVRQHWLEFDCWRSVPFVANAGFEIESSVGYNPPSWGFRCGTAHPFRLPTPETGHLSSVLEVPPVLMDGSFENGDFRAVLPRALDVCQAAGAICTIILHNAALTKREPARAALEWLIGEVHRRGGRFMNANDIATEYRGSGNA